MHCSIRPVCEADAEAIATLLNAIIREGIYTIMDEEISVDEQREFIRGFPERGIFHGAVEQESGEIVGIQDVMPLDAGATALRHVGAISTFVSPVMQGQGIGHALMAATVQAARERGYRKLMATIRADNPRAIAFYRREGFRVIGVAQEHALVGGRYIDEVIAEKLLPQERDN